MIMQEMDPQYLNPTAIIDSDHPPFGPMPKKPSAAHRTFGSGRKLYYAVRDGIWYDPYYPFYLPEHYRASNILKSGRGYCVCKASLLCALGRACGIPSRIGFADVKNHLATRQLLEFLGSDLFVYHGYVEFFLEDKWVKATPAFNRELCERHKVAPLEFNGREDSIFHPFNLEHQKFMEYVADHGVPLRTFPWTGSWRPGRPPTGKKGYRNWIEAFEKQGGISNRDFFKEDVVKK
jgi:hypothetical protein